MTTDIFAPTFEDIKSYVIDYKKRKWTYKQIAQELHLSFGTISKILKSEFGSIDDVLEKKPIKKSIESDAFSLFEKKKTLVQVKVELDIPSSELLEYYKRYQELRGADMYNKGYNKVKGNVMAFLQMFDLMNTLGLSPEQVAEQVKYGYELPQLQSIHAKMNNQIQDLESKHWNMYYQLESMEKQLQQYKNSLQYYDSECMQKRNEIKRLDFGINRKRRFIHRLDNDEGYIRIKEAAKKETKLLMQSNQVSCAVTLSATLEAIRRYPNNQMLISDIITSRNYSTTSYLQPWMDSHAPQLLQLMQNVQNEIAEQITRMIVSTKFPKIVKVPRNESYQMASNKIL